MVIWATSGLHSPQPHSPNWIQCLSVLSVLWRDCCFFYSAHISLHIYLLWVFCLLLYQWNFVQPLFWKIAATLLWMEALSSTKQEDMVDVNLKSSGGASSQTQPQVGGCDCWYLETLKHWYDCPCWNNISLICKWLTNLFMSFSFSICHPIWEAFPLCLRNSLEKLEWLRTRTRKIRGWDILVFLRLVIGS
jgi:hypothetical protein